MIPPGFAGCASCPPDDVCEFCRPRLDLYLSLLGERYGHVRDERVNLAECPQTPTDRRAILESVANVR